MGDNARRTNIAVCVLTSNFVTISELRRPELSSAKRCRSLETGDLKQLQIPSEQGTSGIDVDSRFIAFQFRGQVGARG